MMMEDKRKIIADIMYDKLERSICAGRSCLSCPAGIIGYCLLSEVFDKKMEGNFVPVMRLYDKYFDNRIDFG